MSVTEQSNGLALRLKQETAVDHEHMHVLMEKAAVFLNQENYSKFTLAQYYFQKDIEHLFADENLMDLISDLDIRGRSEAAKADLQDLELHYTEIKLATEQVKFPESIGWLYVSEGSTLGAAFLFKQAQASLGLSAEFGARNLAAYPEGRAKVWKHFISEIDQANLTQEQMDQVVLAAKQGFQRFAALLTDQPAA
ncbi:biliverdin-producing heme oxygenase [Acinetobacter rudis]|uniref:biliverdin-producing heme oxygenase n=1 Tax=Acinetobacter rudis TaxID=632955 RepID=UPI00333F1B6A